MLEQLTYSTNQSEKAMQIRLFLPDITNRDRAFSWPTGTNAVGKLVGIRHI